ncbi:MAG: hypothetical protein CMN54_11000 [SAR324 cluster bacterium]|uniref:Uncharacterized protein n=1 Tax=SAR324 cluster bacterium TaxID=2024889 RepID=A0A2D6YL76_9DELT|nr:hypothetical protein [SAR324 cluster bacterium]
MTAPKYCLLPKDIRKTNSDFEIDLHIETCDKQVWYIKSRFRSESDIDLAYTALKTFKTLSDKSKGIDFCLVVFASVEPIKNILWLWRTNS